MRIGVYGYASLLLIVTPLGVAGQSKSHTSPSSSPACALHEDFLKCPRFGFSYKVPFGWVNRTQEMQSEAGDEAARASGKSDPETLLAIFERPPGTSGETINSAVVIAAEPVTNYPAVKQASDYFGPIGELAEQRGFKVEDEPHAFSVGAKQLVRGDFSKTRGKLTMWQTSLVMIEKGYIVSFTFVAGSEDDADELIGALSFSTHNSARPASR